MWSSRSLPSFASAAGTASRSGTSFSTVGSTRVSSACRSWSARIRSASFARAAASASFVSNCVRAFSCSAHCRASPTRAAAASFSSSARAFASFAVSHADSAAVNCSAVTSGVVSRCASSRSRSAAFLAASSWTAFDSFSYRSAAMIFFSVSSRFVPVAFRISSASPCFNSTDVVNASTGRPSVFSDHAFTSAALLIPPMAFHPPSGCCSSTRAVGRPPFL